jgi:hypothetical protein
MNHASSERLLPLADLPTHLESRGFGSRVSIRTVRKWAADGLKGTRLETIKIGRVTMTSHEAVQRWIDAQAAGGPRATTTQPALHPTTEPAVAVTPEQEASLHLLTEHRVMPTELDQAINALDLPRTTLAYTAGILFRAGLRTPDDARREGHQGLMAIQGMGSRSALVIRELMHALAAGSRQPTTKALPR